MKLEQDCKKIETKIFEWIAENTVKEPFDIVGNPIQRFIPPHFEAYCKILHPFTVDLNAPETRHSEKDLERQEEFKLIKVMCKKLKFKDKDLLGLDLETFIETAIELVLERYNQERSILELPYDDLPKGPFKKDMKIILQEPLKDVFDKFEDMFEIASNGPKHKIDPIEDRVFDEVENKKRLKWEEVAKQYDLKFHDDISITSFNKKWEAIRFPLKLYFPDYTLDNLDCDQLMTILKQFSKTQKVIIQSYSLDYGAINQLCPIEKMFKRDNYGILVGGYIVDENREWIIFADEYRDLQMTILGGSKLLIDALKKETAIEILECSQFSRVDDYSDKINYPPV